MGTGHRRIGSAVTPASEPRLRSMENWASLIGCRSHTNMQIDHIEPLVPSHRFQWYLTAVDHIQDFNLIKEAHSQPKQHSNGHAPTA